MSNKLFTVFKIHLFISLNAPHLCLFLFLHKNHFKLFLATCYCVSILQRNARPTDKFFLQRNLIYRNFTYTFVFLFRETYFWDIFFAWYCFMRDVRFSLMFGINNWLIPHVLLLLLPVFLATLFIFLLFLMNSLIFLLYSILLWLCYLRWVSGQSFNHSLVLVQGNKLI